MTQTKLLHPQSDQAFVVASQELAQSSDRLTVKTTKLQKENHYLRRANRVRPHLKLVVRAEAAAQLLALWHCSGYLTGRPTCLAFGMSERTFFVGKALLIVARVHDGRQWTTDDPETIESKLRAAVKHCRANPTALAWRMPMSRRPKSLRGQ